MQKSDSAISAFYLCRNVISVLRKIPLVDGVRTLKAVEHNENTGQHTHGSLDRILASTCGSALL